ncbi:hypothetical protein [Sinobacterium caligoides]|uniref:hypothetical protein n=1 Tax=Sinobacterium caligoides TaxID=933926 RepID=UPI0011CEAD6C|nr:hypothetical protein [Sinobacterium caligoides]
MRLDLLFCATVVALLALPSLLLGYFFGTQAAVVFIVSLSFMLLALFFMAPVFTRREAERRQQWQQRCEQLLADPAALAIIDFEVVFDSARQHGAEYRGDELSPGEVLDSKQRRYGVVLEAWLDQHTGMQITYWSAQQEYQAMALGDAERAEPGQLIRVDYIAHCPQQQTQELVVAIALEVRQAPPSPSSIL